MTPVIKNDHAAVLRTAHISKQDPSAPGLPAHVTRTTISDLISRPVHQILHPWYHTTQHRNLSMEQRPS
jgi:hypothetical protein